MKNNVFIAVSEEYSKYAYVMLTSLFENNKDLRLRVFVFSLPLSNKMADAFENLTDKYGQEIVFIDLDFDKFEKFPQIGKWTKELWFDLAAFDMLPDDVDRAVYIDADMIVNSSVKRLFEIDFDDNYIAACSDYRANIKHRALKKQLGMKDSSKYINAGFFMINMKKIRQDNKSYLDYFADVCQKKLTVIKFVDQDILNIVFEGKILYLNPRKYNYIRAMAKYPDMNVKEVEKKTVILHYVNSKPWRVSEYDSYGKIFWKYALIGGCYTKLKISMYRDWLSKDNTIQDKVLELIEMIKKRVS